ncbi:MAG: DMT family transporter [Candidatus Sulfobium sp.]|jgi:drug/metabolite transporter (DMT)-like permease
MKNTSNYIKLLAGITAISFSPLAVKLVTFTSTVSAFYRAFYAALFFLIISLFRYRREKGPGHYRWLPPSLAAGVFLGIDLTVWHKTIIFLGAGPATFLGNSQVIFVTLFAAFIFREKMPAVYYMAVAMVLTGLYLLTPAAPLSAGRMKGYVMGLTVGFTYAGMLISLRYAKTLSAGEYPELLSLGAIFSAAASVIALYAAAVEHSALLLWDGRSHAIMMATAFMCQTLGWYLITKSITEIPAHEGSLLLLLQPLLATLWGCIFFLEPLGLLQVLGIVLTLAGITAYQLRYAAKTSGPRLGFEE